MHKPITEPTPYPEVNDVLYRLHTESSAVLGQEFVGLYLYGSLATGDFNLQRSDIDFLIVTAHFLPEETIAALEKMHHGFAKSDNKWDRKLEGLYMPLAELRHYKEQGPELPTVNERHFYIARQGSDWVIQRHLLREHETIVAGHSIRDYIDPVSPQEMRTAVCAIMHNWWAPMIDDPAWLDGRPEYQAFAVQTLCRVLYTLKFSSAVSKTKATQWALEALDEEWKGLIAAAAGWPDTWPTDLHQVQDFIHYTNDQCLPDESNGPA
jgi:hypothetical protein